MNFMETHRVKNDVHISQLASVGQIAAGIAHEVKNPLTAVKGFLQLLKEEPNETYVDIAQSELQNALATLENLLHVAKPDLEEESIQSVNLSVELESLVHLFQDQLYRVEIRKKIHNTDACVYGRKNQLKKAFFNLLKNAFEAIPDKGAITIEHKVEEEQVVISIEDTGTGIPQEKLSMLGTPFFSTKVDGTGMGLTQVFSVIHQHGGRIQVYSEEGKGTRFTLSIPKESTRLTRGVIELKLHSTAGQELRDFFLENRNEFEQCLLAEAVNVKEKIHEIQQVGNVNLLANAHKLVLYIVDGREHDVISFARQEGVVWAKHSLTLAFKLEWVQSIRRVLWDFLYNYDKLQNLESSRENFYSLEKQINELVDRFLNYFFISYSDYKEQLIQKQRELVDYLSVQFIPLKPAMCILPLVGAIDSHRFSLIEDKVITQIGTNKIEVLILDLSGVAEMEIAVMARFLHLLEGIAMMGCKGVITGMRPEIVKVMIRNGISFDSKAIMKGTLQQALVEYMTPGPEPEIPPV